MTWLALTRESSAASDYTTAHCHCSLSMCAAPSCLFPVAVCWALLIRSLSYAGVPSLPASGPDTDTGEEATSSPKRRRYDCASAQVRRNPMDGCAVMAGGRVVRLVRACVRACIRAMGCAGTRCSTRNEPRFHYTIRARSGPLCTRHRNVCILYR